MDTPHHPGELVPLSRWERSGLRLKHTWRLATEIYGLAVRERVWWLIPLILLIVVAAAVVTTTTTTLPYAVYTLF